MRDGFEAVPLTRARAEAATAAERERHGRLLLGVLGGVAALMLLLGS